MGTLMAANAYLQQAKQHIANLQYPLALEFAFHATLELEDLREDQNLAFDIRQRANIFKEAAYLNLLLGMLFPRITTALNHQALLFYLQVEKLLLHLFFHHDQTQWQTADAQSLFQIQSVIAGIYLRGYLQAKQQASIANLPIPAIVLPEQKPERTRLVEMNSQPAAVEYKSTSSLFQPSLKSASRKWQSGQQATNAAQTTSSPRSTRS